jgi:glutamyl-tRNA synthetase
MKSFERTADRRTQLPLQTPNITSPLTTPRSALRIPRSSYRGRIAPSPTGYLHLGHARTFWIAYERAQAAAGTLILRNEDLDPTRSRPQFVASMLEDLRWFGLRWQEGPDVGGPFQPYTQSQRQSFYRAALRNLAEAGLVYPCSCSRKEIEASAQAPHAGDDERIYPGTCRPAPDCKFQVSGFKLSPAFEHAETRVHAPEAEKENSHGKGLNLRFRVPDGEIIRFVDGHFGPQEFIAGKDVGDFIVWRQDDVPAYHLAVVVDDAAMAVTEVVRGADLLVSTARQLLLYRALSLRPPAFFHCPLVTDERGMRLAKRCDSLSLRALRQQGASPRALRAAPPFLEVPSKLETSSILER